MCFVALHRHQGSLYIISNRDENIGRKVAKPPAIVSIAPYEAVMPLDGEAGGTWVAVRNDGVTAVLFNGALRAHQKTDQHTQSRGFIIPRLLRYAQPIDFLTYVDLQHTEPFSLLLAINAAAWLYRWDGITLIEKTLDTTESPCWSSATLYTEEQAGMRRSEWLNWLKSQAGNQRPSFEEFVQLSKNAPAEDSIFMQRSNGLQTVSSTIIQIEEGHAAITYLDYTQNAEIAKTSLPLTKTYIDPFINEPSR